MRQAVMTEPGRIEFREVDMPQPAKGEIRIAVKRIGVCGTDRHVWHGKHPFTPYPVIQGHEFSGIVDAVGEGVDHGLIGARVTAAPQITCGQCRPCLRGDYHICDALKVRGFQAPGCAQDFFLAPLNRAVFFSDAISLDEAALIEPVAVAAHSTARAGGLEGKNVLITGAGTIGNLVAQAARCRGARKVMITDLSAFRLDKAKEAGIEACCHVKEEDLDEAIRQYFGDEGIQVAFEAVGDERALDDAVQNVEKGGRVVVLGVFPERPRVDMSVVGDRELQLIGTLMYRQCDFQQAVDWLEKRRIRVDHLISRTFAFHEYAEAYRYLDANLERTMKVLIDLER